MNDIEMNNDILSFISYYRKHSNEQYYLMCNVSQKKILEEMYSMRLSEKFKNINSIITELWKYLCQLKNHDDIKPYLNYPSDYYSEYSNTINGIWFKESAGIKIRLKFLLMVEQLIEKQKSNTIVE